MSKSPTDEKPWPVSFEAVRLHQHLRFRALSAREKIQSMENGAELVKTLHARRTAAGKPNVKPDVKP